MATEVPDDLLPDDLKPVAPKAQAKVPKAVPLDLLPDDLKPTKAAAIPQEPKSPFATIREALTKPENVAALAPLAGRAIGGLPGELAGMGLGMFALGKKPPIPAMPAMPKLPKIPAAPKPVAGKPELPPGMTIGEYMQQQGVEPTLPKPELPPVPKAEEEGPTISAPPEFKEKLEEMEAKESAASEAARRKVQVEDVVRERQKKASEEMFKPEESFGKQLTRAVLPEFIEEPLLGRAPPEEQIAAKTARFLLPKDLEEYLMGPEPTGPYDKEKLEQELAKWKTYGGEIKMPTPAGLAKRASGGAEAAARMLLGEGKLSREFEERGGLGAALDFIAGKTGPVIENIDPFEPRPSDPERAALWDEIQKNPELLREAKSRWRQIRARRTAEEVPLSDEGLPIVSWEQFKKKQQPVYEDIGKERERLRIANWLVAPIGIPANFAEDLTTTMVSLIEAAAESIGPAIAPETPEVVAAREQLKEAKQSGDKKSIEQAEDDLDTAEQKAVGGKVGGGLAGLPGQVAGLARGLADPDLLQNSLATKPFSTWIMVIEPIRGAGKSVSAWRQEIKTTNPDLSYRVERVATTVRNGAVATAKAILPEWLGKARDWLAQVIGDSVAQGNPELSAIMDEIVNGNLQNVDRLKEIAQRMISRGEVKRADLSAEDIQAVDVWMRPEESVRKVEAATRAAEAAKTKAGKLGAAKAMTVATAEQLAELTKEQNRLVREAEATQKEIATAVTEADRLRIQQKLADLENQRRRVERREETLRKQSQQRGKAKVAAEAAVETAVPFVESAPGGRKVSREFMSQMAEMERKEALADEALRRGLNADEVLRQREDAVRERLGERAYEKVGRAAVAGVELAEQAKAMQPVAAAAKEARRAAAAQAPAVAGAERAARAAEERVAEVAARPEVYMGQTYVPKARIAKPMYSVEEIRQMNEATIQRAKDTPTPENFRRSREAVQELQILDDAQNRKTARVSDYRTDLDNARQAAIEAQELVQKSDAELAELERRAQSARTTVTQQELDQARQQNSQLRMAENDASNAARKAELAYDLIRDVDLPNKVPEFVAGPTFAQGSALEEAMAQMPEGRRQIISKLNAEASDLKKQATEAGANLQVPVADEIADKIGVPRGSSLYTAARRFAEHLTSLNADVPAYMREFLMEQGIGRGAQEAGNWLAKEIEAQNAMIGMVEPQFGYIRRPVATTESGEVLPSGRIEKRAEAAAEVYKKEAEQAAQATGAKREMQKALREMQEITTEPELPKSLETNNKRFDEVLDEFANTVVELGYGFKSPEFTGEPNQFLNAKDLADRKILTPERIKQRVLEVLLDDTMQPMLHSNEYRRALLQVSKKRLQAQGYTGKALREAVAQVREFLMDEKNLSFQSKNRFPDVNIKIKDANGQVQKVTILSREDFTKAADIIAPKVMNKARANAFNYIASRQSVAAQNFNTLHMIDSEVNRFRKNPDGTWKKRWELVEDPIRLSRDGSRLKVWQEVDRAPIDVESYSRQVVGDVLHNNEAEPLIMPYEGKLVANQLERIAQEPQWNAEQRTKIMDVAESLRDSEDAGGLQQIMNSIYNKVFEGADASPPDFHNLYMRPSALRALKSHFAAMGDILQINDINQAIEQAAAASKKGVVPLNVKALVNNDLSCSLLQIITRGAVNFFPRLFTESYKLKKYLDGDHQGMSEYDLQKYRYLSSRHSLFRTQFRNIYGENPAWVGLKKKFGGLARLEAALEAGDINVLKPLEKYQEFKDFLVEMYTKVGDALFRLEEMSHIYDTFYGRLDRMKEYNKAKMRVGKYREIELQKLPNDTFLVKDPTNPSKTVQIKMGSPEMSKILSAVADVMQEEKFLNPQRVGTWFKALQSRKLAALSGIFSWQAGALDIPFVKKGLVSKMMEGPAAFETNDVGIMKEQAADYQAWALKRAMMIFGSQAAFGDQREAEEVRRSLGHNKALLSVVAGPGADPGYLRMRDVAPLLFTGPTTAGINALANLANTVRFSAWNPLNSPDFYAQTLNADQDWAAFTPEQMEGLKETNPSMYEFGEKMRKMAKEDPDAYKHRALIKRDLEKWAKNEVSSPEAALQLAGLAGSPMLRWVIDAQRGGLSPENMRRQFLSMVLGATPYSIADVSAAIAGKAGAESIGNWSTYGTSMGKSGEREDFSSMAEWAISQLFGLGWKQVFYGTGQEKGDDERGFPRTKAYLMEMKKAIDESMLKAMRRKARLPLPEDATPEQIAEKTGYKQSYQMLKNAVDNVYNKSMRALNEQSQKINAPK